MAVKEYLENGKSLKRALTLAVEDHKHELDLLLDDDESDSNSDSKENSDEET